MGLALLLAAGCIQTAGGGGGLDDEDGLVGDGDADADTDADGSGDADADADTGAECPPYPTGPYGLRQGQTVRDFALPGNDADGEWTMADFWCMGQTEGKTVLILNIHSMT